MNEVILFSDDWSNFERNAIVNVANRFNLSTVVVEDIALRLVMGGDELTSGTLTSEVRSATRCYH